MKKTVSAALVGLAGFWMASAGPATAASLPVAGGLSLPPSIVEQVQWREERIIRRGPYGRVVCRIRYRRFVTRSGRVVIRPVEVCRRRGF